MKITVVGKKGCTKCAKMEMILKEKGYETELVYPDGIGMHTVRGRTVELTPDTHFPLYVTDLSVFNTFKELIDAIK